MNSKNKDLTNIEDMGEYVHELEKMDEASSEFSGLQEDEGESVEPFGGDTLPDLPTENDEISFDVSSFDSSEEQNNDFNSTSDFGSSDFITTEEAPESDDMITDMVEETLITKSPLPPLEDDYISPAEKTELKTFAPSPDFKTPEEFKDLKTFAENSSWTGSSAEGNPSFSILLKNVRYIEDVNDILSILKELGLLSDPEEQVRARLMRGHLLVPRVSEFAAIFVAHKLRRFDIDIQVGLSDEIHPPKHHEAPELGMVSKHSLYQNQGHHFHFDDPKLEISQIIVAATPTLEGYQVLRYLGVASEHKMIEGHIVEDDGSDEVPHHYQELAQKLKAHALKVNANAVVGLNYQLTPLPSEYGVLGHKYRLSCTGNLVWVNKL
jgi:uncharacterized protein YbjQ (UPF0145 family)